MEITTIQTPEFETTQITDPREAKLKDIIEKGKASDRDRYVSFRGDLYK